MSLTVRLLNFLAARSRLSVWLMVVLGVLLLGTIDYATGTIITIAFFYLLPVSVASWSLGRRPGQLIALVSALVLEGAQVLAGETGALLIAWNAATRFAVFLVVAELISEFRRLLRHQTELSLTDPLTDTRNRRAFQQAAEQELQAMRQHHRPLSFAFVDLDNFKTVNDTLGHAAGDRLLVGVAEILRSKLWGTDIMARLGGDEFGMLMPQTDASAARRVIPRIFNALAEEASRRNWPVKFSAGVVTCTLPPPDVDSLIHLGDELMYAAKRAGKDRVEYGLYPKPAPEPAPELAASREVKAEPQ